MSRDHVPIIFIAVFYSIYIIEILKYRNESMIYKSIWISYIEINICLSLKEYDFSRFYNVPFEQYEIAALELNYNEVSGSQL